eukprot:1161602-Pelagomonas_calceolata.AAC.12
MAWASSVNPVLLSTTFAAVHFKANCKFILKRSIATGASMMHGMWYHPQSIAASRLAMHTSVCSPFDFQTTPERWLTS